ncbi:M23 family metallopeptidase [Nocardia alni]|uniref:M23 family metallopeptidase n=1 Tax=Nocardia alni TaxID=2815723 RepID=UPI001C22B2A3|nr:M23 family metallopeptidase [Nocardia alni]
MPDQARHPSRSPGNRTTIRPERTGWRGQTAGVGRISDGWQRIRRSIRQTVPEPDRLGHRRRDWRDELRGRRLRDGWLRGRAWVVEHRVALAGLAALALLASADAVPPYPVDSTPAPGVAQRIPIPYPLQVQAEPADSTRDLAAIDNGERLREQQVVDGASQANLDRAKAEAAAAVAGQPSPLLDGILTSLPGGIEAAIGGYALPARGVLTSGYGPRWGTFHYGIDIAAPIGSPIYAVAAGTVIDAGPAQGFGLWVRIRHDDGTISVYGHMYDFSVSPGERVRAGRQIARIGNRGDSSGPHLHFEILVNGQHVDPQPWLAMHGIQVG